MLRLHLGQVGDQVPDRAGVPGAAGAQAERAAQLVVVPGQDAPAAHAADGRRGEDRGGGLVHAALGVGEREHPRAAHVAAQHAHGPRDLGVAGGRGGLPPVEAGRVVAVALVRRRAGAVRAVVLPVPARAPTAAGSRSRVAARSRAPAGRRVAQVGRVADRRGPPR